MEVRFVPLTNETPRSALARIVSEARRREIDRQKLKAEYEENLARLNESYEARINTLVHETNDVMDDASKLVSDHRDELFVEGKTIKFADGEVSIRLGNKAVIMLNGASEKDAVGELRKLGKLLKTTIRPDRKLAKSKITADPSLIAECKTLSVEQRERVSVKLPDNAGKLEHDLPTPPLRRDLGTPDPVS